MPTFNVTLAVTVQAYGHAEIEAETMEQAIELVRQQAANERSEATVWDNVTYIEWDTSAEHRICSIEADDNPSSTSGILEDIPLTHGDQVWTIISADELKGVLAETQD